MLEKKLTVPTGLKPELVANALAAMLWEDAGSKGNSLPHQSSTGFWQLDRGNDFFLVIRESEYILGCRYEREIPVIEAMVAIFDYRFNYNPFRKPAA